MIPPAIYLSPAEQRVLDELLRDGEGNYKIAKRLGLTEDTIKTHIRHIFSKVEQIHPGMLPLTRTKLVLYTLRGEVEFTTEEPNHSETCHFWKWRRAGSPQPRNGPRYLGPPCTCSHGARS